MFLREFSVGVCCDLRVARHVYFLFILADSKTYLEERGIICPFCFGEMDLQVIPAPVEGGN